MKRRAAKKILKRGLITANAVKAFYRYLKYLKNESKNSRKDSIVKNITELFRENAIDINDIDITAIVRLSQRKTIFFGELFNLDYLSKNFPYENKMTLPGKIHKIKIHATLSL